MGQLIGHVDPRQRPYVTWQCSAAAHTSAIALETHEQRFLFASVELLPLPGPSAKGPLRWSLIGDVSTPQPAICI
jgi:hypothetical protein